MFDNQNSSSSFQFADGMTVYDATGDKIGTISQYDPQAGYLDVRKGWLFPKDIYVPTSAVQQVGNDGVYLSLNADDLQGDRYSSPSTALAGGTGSMTYQTTDQTGYSTTQSSTTNTGQAAYGASQTDYVSGGTTQQATGYTSGQSTGTTAQTTGTTGYTSGQTTDVTGGSDIRVPVEEEELVVGKRRAEEGRVHIHKDVIEEPVSTSVQLEREHVVIEREPFSGQVDATNAFQEQDIDVPVYGEEAVVSKQVRGVEEVRLRKDVVTDQQQVSDTVRKERVVVDGVDADGHQFNDSGTDTTSTYNQQTNR
jgi:uncharacterized protein (TIGR02271 family)